MKSIATTTVTLIILLFSGSANGFAQVRKNLSAGEIVSRAGEQRAEYQEVFKNLLSRETRTFEIFGKKGEVRKTRSIVSTFLVYQLTKDPSRISEFRNVKAVDARPVENTEDRAQSLFEAVSKAESSEKEMARIENESQRFDEDFAVRGQTLFQAVPLADNLQPSFEFTLDGQDMIDGNQVYIVSYRQTSPSPYISADPRRLPSGDSRLTVSNDAGLKSGGDLGERLSGKLWIDAAMFQVRREVRVFTLQPTDYPRPVTLAETTFEYQNSDFGILTPRRITHVQYRVSEGDRSSRKEATVTFVYDNFTKPDVEVKSAEVK